MSVYPTPGTPLRLKPQLITGRVGDRYGYGYALTVEESPAEGRALQAGDAQTCTIAMTPAMFGQLTATTPEFYGSSVVATPKPWAVAGGLVAAPPRAVIISGTLADPDAFVAALVAAVGPALVERNIWCAWMYNLGVAWPGMSCLPASGFTECDGLYTDSFNYVEWFYDVPVVDPDLWHGREVLWIHVNVPNISEAIFGTVLGDGSGTGVFTGVARYENVIDAAKEALANTFAAPTPMFSRSEAYFLSKPSHSTDSPDPTGTPGNAAVLEAHNLAVMDEMAAAAAGTHVTLPATASIDADGGVAAAAIARIKLFYGIP